MKYLIEKSINFLEENIKTKPLVLFSGGKDSIVTEKLLKMSGIKYELQSTLTGIDPPQMIKFIRKHYSHCSFVRPKKSFWYLITTHNPPAGTGRGIKWCCTKIKEDPSKFHPIKTRICGIRAEESTRRAKYGEINTIKDQTHFYPIYDWKEYEIWEFIDRFNLPYPKLYDNGLGRVGCVICPNHTPKEHEIYRNFWPNHFKCFEKYVAIWFEKRKRQGRDMWHPSVSEFLKDWYNGKFYYYKH